MFNERLFNYRQGLELTMRDFAKKLNVSEAYYSMIESGKRNPSRRIIEKLVLISERSEEYWIYGIEKKEEVKFENLTKIVKQLMELNLLDNIDSLFQGKYEERTQEELVIVALKKDIKNIKEVLKN